MEFIRIKLSLPGSPALQMYGGVILRDDGVADFFGDAAEHAPKIAPVVDAVRLDVPFGRVTLDDLDADGPALLADALVIDGRRVLGPLLLRPDRVPAVAGTIDAECAARIHRALLTFLRARGVATAMGRDGADIDAAA